MTLAATAAPTGSALASWNPLVTMLALFAAAVVTLFALGSGRRPLSRILGGLERVTKQPGWAMATIGTALFGLLVAGQGFYSDVAWHIALGRDKELFTAPHTAIALGLVLIAASSVVCVIAATIQKVPTALRLGALRVPWSAVPLGALGFAALSGFPLDELWHGAYGIDVTMWSPTHMLMILGASFTGMAAWFVLTEAGVRPQASPWGRGLHLLCAWLTLQGLAASQGEFSFGVPQFQQLYHPVLVMLAGALAAVAGRLVLGPGWMAGVALFNALFTTTRFLDGDDSPVSTRAGGIYVATILLVELVASLLGTEKRTRFAVVSGLAAGTVGLAGEWWWNRGAYQPWTSSLVPEAIVLGVAAAVGAALLGAAFGSAIRAEGRGGISRGVVGVGAALAVLALVVPFPRTTGDVTADVTLIDAGNGTTHIQAVLDPEDAADDARWFQSSTWQGGTLELSTMVEVEPGLWRTERPVTLGGTGKTLLRLHRGSEMNAIAISLPADPEIGKSAIPAVDRDDAPFVNERRYLLREQKAGDQWFAYLIYFLMLGVVVLWAAAFVLACNRIGTRVDLSTEAQPVTVS